MLTLTEGATQAIKGLVGNQEGAGLRIFRGQSDSEDMQLGLSISDAPEPTDEVVEQSGCQVFLDQQVAPLVDGQTLDASPVEGGRVQFAFVG
jgi:Fe-S cluster assembly iron-binding protein IscA